MVRSTKGTASIGLALAVALGTGCEGGSGWSDLTADVRMMARAVLATLSPPTYVLDFEHAVGSTECPQVIDEWTFENTGDAPVAIEVLGGPPALEVAGTSFELPAAGGTGSSTVRFTCSAATDVDETLQIGVARAGATFEYIVVEVRGTVR